MIPKYVVFNIGSASRGNNVADPVCWGDDLDKLLSIYHGKNYQVMQVRTLTDREEW